MLIGALTLLIGKLAFVLARQEINAITPLDPDQFSNAPSNLGLLFTIVLWLQLALILTAGYVVFSMLRAMLQSMANDSIMRVTAHWVVNHPFVRYVARFPTQAEEATHLSRPSFGEVLGGVGVLFVLASPLTWATPERVRTVSTAVLLASEYLPYSNCLSHRDGEMVAFVGDYISVARTTRGEIAFELRKCEVVDR